MAKRLKPIERRLTFECDGTTVEADAQESVAEALIASNQPLFSRSIKYHRPRGAFCLSGACSNCLMRVDGVPNLPTCQVTVAQGIQVSRQNSFPDARFDVFAANDLVFPKWFNHHEFLAGVPIADKLLLKIARQLAGLGTLPDGLLDDHGPAQMLDAQVAIVGAGAAGLSASRALSIRGVAHVLIDRRPTPALEKSSSGLGTIKAASTVLGIYQDADTLSLLVQHHRTLTLVNTQWLVLANGAYPTLLTFENNDLPGIYAAQAVSQLIEQRRILPGKTIAVVGEMEQARALAATIRAVGAEPVAVGAQPLKAHGFQAVSALTVNEDGTKKYPCDAVALCAKDSPSYELARAAGANVIWEPLRERFVVEADASGRTRNPRVFAAGQVRGPMSKAAATEQGLVAGTVLAKALS
jgi:sarcosine oxidase, subunit alpha